MPYLSGMAVFVKVVEVGGISAAARVLDMPKSSVSRHIGRLEERLQVRLLNRNTRALSMTEAGATYFERCQVILAEAEAAEQAVAGRAAGPNGRLRVGAAGSVVRICLMPMVCEFLAAYPEVSVDLSIGNRTAKLVEEALDVAVCVGPLADSSAVARRVGSIESVLCASPGYLRDNGRPQSIEALREHRWLVVDGSEARLRFADGRNERSVVVPWRLCASDAELLRVAALDGRGPAVLPRALIGADLQRGDLVELLKERPPLPSDVHAVHHGTRRMSPNLRVFIDALVRHFAAADRSRRR